MADNESDHGLELAARGMIEEEHQPMNRTKHLSWVVALLLFDACALPATALEPANPKANGKARAILDYLERLPQRSDKRMLSGQFSDCGPMAKLAMCEEVHTKTGHWPAMIGLDYADCAKAGLEYKTVNRVAIEYARAGWSPSRPISATQPIPRAAARGSGAGISRSSSRLATRPTTAG